MPRSKNDTFGNLPDGIINTRPSMDPSNREKQLINKAYNLAEKKLDDGTASDSTINYLLKLGSEQQKTLQAKINFETELLRAKTLSLEAESKEKGDTAVVLDALKSYSPSSHD